MAFDDLADRFLGPEDAVVHSPRTRTLSPPAVVPVRSNKPGLQAGISRARSHTPDMMSARGHPGRAHSPPGITAQQPFMQMVSPMPGSKVLNMEMKGGVDRTGTPEAAHMVSSPYQSQSQHLHGQSQHLLHGQQLQAPQGDYSLSRPNTVQGGGRYPPAPPKPITRPSDMVDLSGHYAGSSGGYDLRSSQRSKSPVHIHF